MKSNRANVAMELAEDVLTKIRSPELRIEAQNADQVPHTIIVEVNVPLPSIERSDRAAITPGRNIMRFSQPRATPSILGHIRDALREALGHEPERYLPSSRAFVVEATGDEIRRLAEIPDVLAIWPNTKRFGSLPLASVAHD